MGFGESLDAVVALIQTSVYREDCVFREAVVRVERIVDVKLREPFSDQYNSF